MRERGDISEDCMRGVRGIGETGKKRMREIGDISEKCMRKK